eukprot:2810942-Rhodomonas_salina.2
MRCTWNQDHTPPRPSVRRRGQSRLRGVRPCPAVGSGAGVSSLARAHTKLREAELHWPGHQSESAARRRTP